MKSARFSGVLQDGQKGCAVLVPFDPAVRCGTRSETLVRGRRGHAVRASIARISFESAIVARSKRFWPLVGEDLVASARLRPGEAIEVGVEPR